MAINAYRRRDRYNEGVPVSSNPAVSPEAVLPDLGMVSDQSQAEAGFIHGILGGATAGILASNSSQGGPGSPGSPATSQTAVQAGASATAAPTVGPQTALQGTPEAGGVRVPEGAPTPTPNMITDQSKDTYDSTVGTIGKKVAAAYVGGVVGEAAGKAVGEVATEGAATAVVEGSAEAAAKSAATEGYTSGALGAKTTAPFASTGPQFEAGGVPTVRSPALPPRPPSLTERAVTAAKDAPGNYVKNIGESLGITDSVIQSFQAGDYATAFKQGGTNLVRNQLEARVGTQHSKPIPMPKLNSFPRVRTRQQREEEGMPGSRFSRRGGGSRFSR